MRNECLSFACPPLELLSVLFEFGGKHCTHLREIPHRTGGVFPAGGGGEEVLKPQAEPLHRLGRFATE